jgi:hypothetical protein
MLSVGLELRTSYKREYALRLATGMKLLLKKNAKPLTRIIKISNALMNLNKDIPEDFIATNSKFSPKLPNVIIEARRMLKGSASGTRVVDM